LASFPDSVKSFAARSNGQTIDASHVGDLQDEVNALESGYLNGTARLNSSASTLASLDVNGNSTLASSITLGAIPYVFPSSGGSTGQVLTCVSTSGSTMGLEWRASGNSNMVRSVVKANLSSTSGEVLTLTFQDQDYALNSSLHSTGTNPTRFTPDSTGVWGLTAQAAFSAAAGGYRQLTIEDSTGLAIGRTLLHWGSSASVAARAQCRATKRFDVTGGYFQVTTAHDATSTVAVQATETWAEFAKIT